MVWRKNMWAFQLCLCNNSLAVETDKHAGAHGRRCRYTQYVHTVQTSFSSQRIAPTAALDSRRELFSYLTGCRVAVSRPELFMKQAALPRRTSARAHTNTHRYKHRSTHPHAAETCQTARLRWKKYTQTHTRMADRETRTSTHTKNRNTLNMDLMTEYTNTCAETNTQTVGPGKGCRGNFLLLQLILNMCQGFCCNLL